MPHGSLIQTAVSTPRVSFGGGGKTSDFDVVSHINHAFRGYRVQS